MIVTEITKRRSVREYKSDDVSEELINEIVKAGQFAPTAHDNRAVEFIVIKNPSTKKAIFEIVGQEYVKDAPVLLIPTTDATKTVCPVEDLSVVSENIFLQAVTLGLGTVWKAVEQEPLSEGKIKELLGIPVNYKIINIIPIGYPNSEVKVHGDEDFDQSKIHLENW